MTGRDYFTDCVLSGLCLAREWGKNEVASPVAPQLCLMALGPNQFVSVPCEGASLLYSELLTLWGLPVDFRVQLSSGSEEKFPADRLPFPILPASWGTAAKQGCCMYCGSACSLTRVREERLSSPALEMILCAHMLQ